MSLPSTLLLGFIAGVTILIGLPVGRLTRPAPSLRLMLNSVAVGILLFLVWDVFTAAWEPIDGALSAMHEGTGSIAPALGYGSLFAAGLAIGLLALVGYERRMGRMSAALAARRIGPGAATMAELVQPRGVHTWSAAKRMALMIAVGIGLHNFAEGLAIGQSAGRGDLSLATLLVIGFALHNATEGFGIVAPLAGKAGDDGDTSTPHQQPSWGFLLGMGLIAGGPTFIGSAVGHSFTSDALNVVFLTLAAGSMVYVIAQLLGVAGRAKRPDLVAYGLLIGLLAGFVTDAIVTAGGA